MLALAAITLTACHDDDQLFEYNFNARVEQPTASDGSKVFLLDEHYIYWELDDKITIGSDQGIYDPGNKATANPATDEYYSARLINANALANPDQEDFGFFNGVFVTTMQWGSSYFLGIHPKMNRTVMPSAYCSYSSGSSNFGTTVKMYLPSRQPLRTDEKGDITFNKQVWPMVAWYGGQWTDSTTAFNLDFHSVGTIVRVQLFDSTGVGFTLDSIEFTSRNNATQLSGIFEVENYKTEDPHMKVKAGAVTESEARIVITTPGIPFNGDSLRSFYLVLPAYQGRHASTTFELTMKVYAAGSKTFSKNFSVTTRRNGITYLRAIGIKEWADGLSDGTMSTGLVGNGTQTRPFKVYTVADLVYLRNCYNGSRCINNQPVSANTYIRIMRSDIVLTPANWSNGINNFVGHLSYTTTGATGITQGITNNSGRPLFNSISVGGEVEGLTVNMSADIVLNGSHFSPFCIDNSGKITNCRIMSRNGSSQGLINIQSSSGTTYGLAGICVNNNTTGKVSGCGCVAQFNSRNRNVTGICLLNNGTIEGCYVSAPMAIKAAATASGICYTNYSGATVKDCYFSTITDSVNCSWGGIVHTNRGTVEHCYSRETAGIISSSSVGGIVNHNIDGTVDYCWSEAALKGNGVGLIVAQTAGGKIINCFCNNPLTSVTLHATTAAHFGGGLVGDATGSSAIANCYVYISKVQLINNIGEIGGLVGRVRDNTVRITNCYAYEATGGSQAIVGNIDAGATSVFSYCYLVGGSGTQPSGVDNISTANAALDANNTEGLTYKLNQHVPDNGKDWVLSGGVPVLEAYTIHNK